MRSKPSINSPIIGAAYIGQIFDSSGIKYGDNISGNNAWYELTIGGYIWATNAKEYTKPAPVMYSQADWRWSWKYLGWGGWGQTIGNYGCALTSCAMMSGIQPDTLNEYMKRVGGYAENTLIIWSKLEKATSGKLKYVQGLGIPYNDYACKKIIEREKACLVQVYGSGLPMHFVVAIGQGVIIDPIDGKTKPFMTYNPVELREIIRT